MNASGTFFGSSNVRVNGDSHSDVASKNGGHAANEVGYGGVAVAECGLNGEEEENGEAQQEDGEVQVLLSQEGDSSLYIIINP